MRLDFHMTKVMEIEASLSQLPLHEAQRIARWLDRYLEQQSSAKKTTAVPPPLKLPDYATRRQMIFGEKVLPNMVLLDREQERW